MRLSGGIAELVDNLEMHPFRHRVSATAGSGKSLLAVRFFERMVANGKRSALVCFNRPLCEQLKKHGMRRRLRRDPVWILCRVPEEPRSAPGFQQDER